MADADAATYIYACTAAPTSVSSYNAQLPDGEWLDRHHDYQQLPAADVWIWHTAASVPDIVYEHGLPGWTLTDDLTTLRAHIAPPATAAPTAGGPLTT